MAEYQSFHYLMHKTVEAPKAFYVQGGPQASSFQDLYSPRDCALIHKSEKSYWRTRDRIEYAIWEDRQNLVLIITCRNIDSNEPYRTIFINLEKLYDILETKVRGGGEQLGKKKDKKLADDKELYKAASDYCLARLNIKAEPLPWPVFQHLSADAPVGGIDGSLLTTSANTSEAAAVAAIPIKGNDTSLSADPATLERMCTLDKLTGDDYDSIEVACPFPLNGPNAIAGIDHLKLNSTFSQITALAGQAQELQPIAAITAIPSVSDAATTVSNTMNTSKDTKPAAASTGKNKISGGGSATAVQKKATASTSTGSIKAGAKPSAGALSASNSATVAPSVSSDGQHGAATASVAPAGGATVDATVTSAAVTSVASDPLNVPLAEVNMKAKPSTSNTAARSSGPSSSSSLGKNKKVVPM